MLWTILLSALLIGVDTIRADVTGTNPSSGTCLCLSSSGVNVRSAACGTNVLGTAGQSDCYTSRGQKQRCRLNGNYYDFFSVDYNGRNGWIAGNFLNASPASSCGGSPSLSSSGGVTPNEGYMCRIENQGKRIHESPSATGNDCKDSSGRNTCAGGQCVAYVVCSCTRNGGYAPPITINWRPGTRVVNGGRCNRNIPNGTAIATFNPSGRYPQTGPPWGHAAAFLGCESDESIKVYDQYCGRSVGVSYYRPSNERYSMFAVITNPGGGDRGPWYQCRVQTAGSTTKCKA